MSASQFSDEPVATVEVDVWAAPDQNLGIALPRLAALVDPYSGAIVRLFADDRTESRSGAA